MLSVTLVTVYLLLCLQTLVRTEPTDCPFLRTIIPECGCESGSNDPINDIIINCRYKGLTSMPLINGSYGGIIYEFTLAENAIENLPEEAFKNLRIQRIDMTANKLKNISETAFRGLETTLIVLKISGNAASNVSPPFTAISNLTNLQELSLQNFRIGNNNDLEGNVHFQPFSNLLKLTLDNWGLKSIGDNVFLGLTSLQELTLSKHGALVTYPVGAVYKMRQTIQRISVTETGITKLQFYGFDGLQTLKRLVLRSNNIILLEEECFKGIEDNLEYLDLSFNNIPATNLSRLQTLRELQFLKLQNIGLENLPQNPQFLLNKLKLIELDLSRNHLSTIPSNALDNLPMLTMLELSQNSIATMANDSLNALTSLQTLHLDSQTLSGGGLTLPSLTTLTSLDTLVLEQTTLSDQSWNKISQAHALRTLKMRKTGLTAIPNLVFNMMTNLTTLDLSDNQIANINQETFVGPRNSLNDINLSKNKIGTFDSCTFSNYTTSLKLDLYQNPLRCDCSLYWLSVAVKTGQISFHTEIETCFYPPNLNGTTFTSHDPSVFCNSVPSTPQCGDYYTTTTTTPTPTTTLPSVNINVVEKSTSINSITVTWTLDLPQYINHIIIVHTELPSGQPISSRQLSTTISEYTVSKLKSNKNYQICVEAHRIDNKLPDSQCIFLKTQKSTSEPSTTTVDPQADGQMSNNTEIGIIIGAVIGGLVVFGILVAIIYLMIIRKKSPKESYPIQPRNFTRAELPTVGYDSKRYRKQKKKDETDSNKNDVSVTVISDGKTGPNIGRISAGSYQYLQDKQPVNSQPNAAPSYANDAATKKASFPYENDVNMRPLPHPSDSAGYYDNSFKKHDADDKQPHTYSEINL